jgi:hypothetical protein
MTKTIRTDVIAVWCCASMLAACGGAPGGPVDAGSGCERYAATICNKLSCFPELPNVTYGDTATCIERTRLACEPTLKVSGTGLTVAKLDACSAGYAALACQSILYGEVPSACEVTGTFADGAACGIGHQCQSGYCKMTNDNCGVCAVRSAVGGSCGSSADCLSASFCNLGTCTALGVEGAACHSNKPCHVSLDCKAGTCTKSLTTAGAACDASTSTSASSSCDISAALYCDSKTSVCTKMQTATAGNPCGSVNGVLTLCITSLCKYSTDGSGTCVAFAADGAACNEAESVFCQPPASCVSGVCTIVEPATFK